MKLENGYKVIYEKAVDGARTFYASKTGVCNPDVDDVIANFVDNDYKGRLVYEQAGKFYVTAVGSKVPAFDANGNSTDECLDAFNKVFVAGADVDPVTETDEVVENPEDAPVEDPAVEPTDEEDELGGNDVTE